MSGPAWSAADSNIDIVSLDEVHVQATGSPEFVSTDFGHALPLPPQSLDHSYTQPDYLRTQGVSPYPQGHSGPSPYSTGPSGSSGEGMDTSQDPYGWTAAMPEVAEVEHDYYSRGYYDYGGDGRHCLQIQPAKSKEFV